jgi:hypothetical protein
MDAMLMPAYAAEAAEDGSERVSDAARLAAAPVAIETIVVKSSIPSYVPRTHGDEARQGNSRRAQGVFPP